MNTASQRVTQCQTVEYRLSGDDIAAIGYVRAQSFGHPFEAKGSAANIGDVVPLIVVKVFDSQVVSGQAVLDGNHNHWVQLARQGDGPGCWNWPRRI